MTEPTPKKIEKKVPIKIFRKGYEFCIKHSIDFDNLEFYENGESVDVFVRRE